MSDRIDSGGYRDEAREQVLKLLAERDRLSDQEREALQNVFDDMEAQLARLEDNEVHIAVFGEINAGKSSLLNALVGKPLFGTGPIGGWTKDLATTPWDAAREIDGMAGVKLFLLDTPGLNEVDGGVRETLAKEAARKADLIVFVTDSDINDTEYRSIREMMSFKKAVILALNKVDAFRRKDLDQLLEAVRKRVDPMIPASLVVPCAADPGPIRVYSDDGDDFEEREQSPRIGPLVEAIFEVLSRDGRAIVALNALGNAVAASDTLNSKKVELRREVAEALVFRRAIFKALAVAANPVPVGDLVGGVALDALMVVSVGKVFGIELSLRGADKLALQIVEAAAAIFGSEAALQSLMSGAKLVPFVGHVIVAVPQGAIAYLFSQLLGRASIEYFERGGSWGSGGPKVAVQRIVDQVIKDKKTYLADAAKLIKDELSKKGR